MKSCEHILLDNDYLWALIWIIDEYVMVVISDLHYPVLTFVFQRLFMISAYIGCFISQQTAVICFKVGCDNLAIVPCPCQIHFLSLFALTSALTLLPSVPEALGHIHWQFLTLISFLAKHLELLLLGKISPEESWAFHWNVSRMDWTVLWHWRLNCRRK